MALLPLPVGSTANVSRPATAAPTAWLWDGRNVKPKSALATAAGVRFEPLMTANVRRSREVTFSRAATRSAIASANEATTTCAHRYTADDNSAMLSEH